MNFMKQQIFKSDRHFSIFDVLVSHGQLLLRSQKNDNYVCNIDIVFFDTKYIQLFTSLNGVTITVATNKKDIDYPSVKKYLGTTASNLFEIESRNERYYIAASFVKVFENELDFNETSLNFDKRGKQKEIASSVPLA